MGTLFGKLRDGMARKKNPHAVALGRLGGRARAGNLSPEELSEIARKGGLKGGRGRFDNLSDDERQALASAGGKAGGKARAEKLTPEQRREIARNAAKKRWAAAKKAVFAAAALGLAYAGWKWK